MEKGRLIQRTHHLSSTTTSTGKFHLPFKIPPIIISEVGNRELDGFHAGMDISAGAGEAVLSISDGTVIRVSTSCSPYGGYIGNRCPADDAFAWGAGNFVMIRFEADDKEYYALYASSIGCHCLSWRQGLSR